MPTNVEAAIYAIIDNVAGQIIGGLQLHKHDASAIRTFTDIATDPKTNINRHPADFDLYLMGYLVGNHSEAHDVFALQPDFKLVLAGSAWAAAQQKTTQLTQEA